jgi:hypothetical protein
MQLHVSLLAKEVSYLRLWPAPLQNQVAVCIDVGLHLVMAVQCQSHEWGSAQAAA